MSVANDLTVNEENVPTTIVVIQRSGHNIVVQDDRSKRYSKEF